MYENVYNNSILNDFMFLWVVLMFLISYVFKPFNKWVKWLNPSLSLKILNDNIWRGQISPPPHFTQLLNSIVLEKLSKRLVRGCLLYYSWH